MKYTLYVTTKGRLTTNDWYLRLGAFVLQSEKMNQEWQPQWFDTIEAASSKLQELKVKGENKHIKIAEFNGLDYVKDVTPLHIQKAQIATDEHGD